MSGEWITFKKALAAIPADRRSAEMIEHGSMTAGVYAPHESDDQDSHDRDQLYLVVNGTGFFRIGDERRPFGAGDLLFVEAATEHRFEDFTPDFAAWSILWGPEDRSEG